MSQNTNLSPSGQDVQVSGTGFGPSGSGAIQQCVQRDEFTEDCSNNVGTFTTDASGNFGAITVTVQETFTAGGQPATCSVATPCSLFAQMNAQPQNAHESLSFTGTTTTVAPDECAQLPAGRAAFNAQIDANIAAVNASSLTAAQKAAVVAQLQAVRAQGNAQIDAARAAAGCSVATP